MGERSYDRKVLYVFFFFGGRLRMPPPPPDAYRTKGTAVVGSRNLGIDGTAVGLAGAVRLSLAKEARHRLREAICRSANENNGLRCVANSRGDFKSTLLRKKLGPSCKFEASILRRKGDKGLPTGVIFRPGWAFTAR
jgi:hypothetical protein